MPAKTKRRREITTEMYELTIIRFGQRQTAAFCRGCRTESTHTNAATAALALAITESAVFRLAERGEIHSTESPEGMLMLCCKSIAGLKNTVEYRGGEAK